MRATLLDLIAQAYHLQYFQISSTTPLDAQRFDLVAKIPPGATKEQFRAMMRGFLAERFHLNAHVVSKEFPAMEMVVAKGGPKLKEAAPTADGRPHHSLRQSFDGGFTVIHVICRQYTIADFAEALPQPGGPSIVDKTGLTGRYDIDLDYTIERPNSAVDGAPGAPPAPDLAVALREQLGLQLARTKLMLDVVMVDAVDKAPVEN